MIVFGVRPPEKKKMLKFGDTVKALANFTM